MLFRFEHAELGVDDNVRLAAKAEFDRAIAEVSETGFEVHGTVRNVRRRLKRVRAILRLIRPVFPQYAAENAALRTLGAEVAGLRDRMALVEAVDLLMRVAKDETEAALVGLRRELVQQAAAEEASLNRDSFLTKLRSELREARVRSELWELKRKGSRAVVPGFGATYRVARKGFRHARDGGHDERFHEWRKSVKHHAAQLSLLSGLMPQFAEGRRRQAKKLARTLGELQNLSVLATALREHMPTLSEGDKHRIGRLLAEAIAGLRGKALRQGRGLFAERPGEVRRRWQAYWSDWQAVRRLG